MQSKTMLTIAALATFGTLANAQDKSSEKDILTIYKGTHSYKQVSVAGKTTEVYVDDRQVAGNEIPHYDSLIRALRTDVAGDDRDLARQDDEEARDDAQGERDRAQGERDRAEGERDRQQGERDREQGQLDREQGQRDRDQAQFDREQGQRDREQGERDREQGQRDREEAQRERAAMQEIIQFVLDKKIVPDEAHLGGLVLTDSAFYVNDVKQPEEYHQALKQKYPEWAHSGISFGSACDSGVTIHISHRED